MLASDLLDTPIVICPEMSEADFSREWAAAKQRSRMIDLLIQGRIDWETYLDFMAQAGYEPCDLLDAAEENLQFCINEGIVIER